MAGCRKHYDVFFVDNKCDLIGVMGLRSITSHHRTLYQPNISKRNIFLFRFVEKEGQSLDEKRKELERFVFYSDRYLSHMNSLKFDKDLYKLAADKATEAEMFNMGMTEAQFLKRAVDILCRCRKTLMYTYVFGYYLNKNNQKVIFEENQKDLETAIDTLSGYMEREVTSVADLKDMKAKVLDKSTYCEMRRKVLVGHVYEGNDQDWWDIRN